MSTKRAKKNVPQSEATPVRPPEKKYITGLNVSAVALRQLIVSFIGLARQTAALLTVGGWPPELTDRMESGLVQFDRESTKYIQSRSALTGATQEVDEGRVASLPLRRQVTAALKLCLQDDPAALRELRTLSRTSYLPAQLAGWFVSVQPMIEAVHAQMKTHFPTDPLELVRAKEALLMKALAKQGTLLRTSTTISDARDAVRSELVASINQLKLVAIIAFADNPTLLRGFNKGLGRRAARKAAAGTQPQDPATPPGPAAAAPAAAEPAQAEPAAAKS